MTWSGCRTSHCAPTSSESTVRYRGQCPPMRSSRSWTSWCRACCSRSWSCSWAWWLPARVPRDSWVVRSAYRSEEHTSELQSLMRTSYAVFCLKQKKQTKRGPHLEHPYDETNDITYSEPHY